jgi:hypothetical protein
MQSIIKVQNDFDKESLEDAEEDWRKDPRFRNKK